MKVIEYPADESSNPYNGLLCASLRDWGPDVIPWRRRLVLRDHVDIVHVHWPGTVFRRRRPVAAAVAAGVELVLFGFARRRGAKLVYTVHNLQPHDASFSVPERIYWRIFLRLVDAYIVLQPLTEASKQSLGALAKRPCLETRHGKYKVDAPARSDARLSLGYEPEHRLIVMVGRIEPYKNPLSVIEAFRDWDGPHNRLAMVGRVNSALEGPIFSAIRGDERIRVVPHHVTDEELAMWVSAADAVVVPYTKVLNSGTALLAASCGTVFVAPASETMAFLREDIGADWFFPYDGYLTADILESCVESVLPALPPDLRRHSWPLIAREHLQFFQELTPSEPPNRRSRRRGWSS